MCTVKICCGKFCAQFILVVCVCVSLVSHCAELLAVCFFWFCSELLLCLCYTFIIQWLLSWINSTRNPYHIHTTGIPFIAVSHRTSSNSSQPNAPHWVEERHRERKREMIQEMNCFNLFLVFDIWNSSIPRTFVILLKIILLLRFFALSIFHSFSRLAQSISHTRIKSAHDASIYFWSTCFHWKQFGTDSSFRILVCGPNTVI